MDCWMLWWIGRFRFVTAAELSLQCGVSEQRINARVRRFLREGLVAEHREHVSQSRAIFLTARGASVIGQPRRKPPRADTQRRHELAVVRIAIGLELDPELADARVMSERECRQAEQAGDRFSVEVLTRAGRQKRWPDLVVDFGDDRRQAFELELAIKLTARLDDIVGAYVGSFYREVVWLVELPPPRRSPPRPHRHVRELDLPRPHPSDGRALDCPDGMHDGRWARPRLGWRDRRQDTSAAPQQRRDAAPQLRRCAVSKQQRSDAVQ
jgi:hypothetical protein